MAYEKLGYAKITSRKDSSKVIERNHDWDPDTGIVRVYSGGAMHKTKIIASSKSEALASAQEYMNRKFS